MAYDYVVIGAGMAGASAACELAARGSVAMIEAESAPGYHSTGRSAALFTPNYGSDLVRCINRCSRDFFLAPPTGFVDVPLLSPRGALTIFAPDKAHLLDAVVAAAPDDDVIPVTAEHALALAPVLRPDAVGSAALEPGVMDIDVHALHQAYLRGFRERGGALLCNTRAETITRKSGEWRIRARDVELAGSVVINAAGAWADHVGAMAGAMTIGLVPKRRTAVVLDAPDGVDAATMPAVDFAGSEAYLKPEGGRIMASLGDETPTVQQDVQPEELDIAMAADWLQRHTVIPVRRIEHAWAGLRSFVADGAPVVGFDSEIEDFFWLAAQGGYGIMMAPTLACIADALVCHEDIAEKILKHGVSDSELAPGRLRQ